MTMKVFASGEVLTAADLNEYGVNVKYVRKASDESVTSSITLQDDNELFMAVDANKAYELLMVATFVGATAGDMKWSLTGPAGTTLCTASTGIQTAGTGSGDDLTEAYNQALPITQTYGALPAQKTAVYLHGLVIVAGTPGNILLQWAQGTSSATPTTVHAGSFIIMRRVS